MLILLLLCQPLLSSSAPRDLSARDEHDKSYTIVLRRGDVIVPASGVGNQEYTVVGGKKQYAFPGSEDLGSAVVVEPAHHQEGAKKQYAFAGSADMGSAVVVEPAHHQEEAPAALMAGMEYLREGITELNSLATGKIDESAGLVKLLHPRADDPATEQRAQEQDTELDVSKSEKISILLDQEEGNVKILFQPGDIY